MNTKKKETEPEILEDGLTAEDIALLERLKNTRDYFGERVNAIEAQVS